MKKIKFIGIVKITYSILIVCLIGIFSVVSSCNVDAGHSKPIMSNGDDTNLPEHLKGLKVDKVGLGGVDIYVATLPDHNVVSTEYSSGKTHTSVIVILGDSITNDERIIKGRKILLENDTVVMILK